MGAPLKGIFSQVLQTGLDNVILKQAHPENVFCQSCNVNEIQAFQIADTDQVEVKSQSHPLFIPVGPMRILHELSQIGHGSLFVISSDASPVTSELDFSSALPCESFYSSAPKSWPVDYSLLAHFFDLQPNGFAWCTEVEGHQFSVFGLGLPELLSGSRSSWEFQSCRSQFYPATMSMLQAGIYSSPQLALSLLRMTRHDPAITLQLKSHLIDKVSGSSEHFRCDLHRELTILQQNLYPLPGTRYDISFDLARLFMALQDFSRAIDLFNDSVRYCGSHPLTHFNLGLCFHSLDKISDAKQQFALSMAQQGGRGVWSEARAWFERLEKFTSPQKVNAIKIVIA